MVTSYVPQNPATPAENDAGEVIFDCCPVQSMADDDFLLEEVAVGPADTVLLDAGIESQTGTEDRDFDL